MTVFSMKGQNYALLQLLFYLRSVFNYYILLKEYGFNSAICILLWGVNNGPFLVWSFYLPKIKTSSQYFQIHEMLYSFWFFFFSWQLLSWSFIPKWFFSMPVAQLLFYNLSVIILWNPLSLFLCLLILLTTFFSWYILLFW